MPFTESFRTDAINVSLCTSSAPTIDTGLGVPTTYNSISSDNDIFAVNANFVAGGTTGFRKTLPAAVDLTVRKYVVGRMVFRSFGLTDSIETTNNGGMILLFIDSNGNYSGYNVYGSEALQTFSYVIAGAEVNEGLYSGYTTYGNRGSNSFLLDRNVTPDYSSGVLDWSDITAVECHIRAVTTRTGRIYGMCDVFLMDDVVYTGSVPDISDLCSEFSDRNLFPIYVNDGTSPRDCFSLMVPSPATFSSSFQRQLQLKSGLTFGDGVIQTTLNYENVAISFDGIWADQSQFPMAARFALMENDRILGFNCSSTDSYTFTDCSFASTSLVSIQVYGDSVGIAEFNNCTFFALTDVQLGHGTLNGGTVLKCSEGLKVTSDSFVNSTALVNGGGLVVEGAPGSYPNLKPVFNDETNDVDITIDPTSAGTFTLPNIDVRTTRSLIFHNASATEAITVSVPPGTLYTTTTAGGSITVIADNSVNLTATGIPEGLEARLRLGSVTIPGQYVASVSASGTAVFTFDGTTYTGRSATLTIGGVDVNGVAYERQDINLQLPSSDQTIPIGLLINPSYI